MIVHKLVKDIFIFTNIQIDINVLMNVITIHIQMDHSQYVHKV